MKKTILVTIVVILGFAESVVAAELSELTWPKVAEKMPSEWYGSDEAVSIAQTVVSFQTDLGGWPKNVQYHIHALYPEKVKANERICSGTFDNGATITEMRFLAKVFEQRHLTELKASFQRGIDYIIAAQYDNGGWPQFWPVRQGRSVAYSGCITYNDGAYVNVMNLLLDIITGKKNYRDMVADGNMDRVQKAFDKGIDCILKTQIVVEGTPTIWCAQHDAVTLAPAKARAYELPSFSGAESVGIMSLLMSVDNPSPEIIRAVDGAARWFEEHKITDLAYERYKDEAGEKEARIVEKPGNVMWARFYDLDTGEPFVCDRDGVKRKSIYELGKNRRGGYSWYVTSPQKALEEYQRWKNKITR